MGKRGFYRKIQDTGSSNNDDIYDRNNLLSLFNFSERVGQIGKVAVSVYIVDVLSVILTTLGFGFPQKIQLSSSYSKISCTLNLDSVCFLFVLHVKHFRLVTTICYRIFFNFVNASS
jgi:hypothetical protein